MRTHDQIRHNQMSLYYLRVEQGRYLADVAYEELRKEEVASLMKEAEHLHHRTGLELRKVKLGRKWVWRFMNRSGL